MRDKKIIIPILTLFFVLIPSRLLAEDATKAALDLLGSLLPMGIAVGLAVVFIVNQINTAKKEVISYTDAKFLEAIKYVDRKDTDSTIELKEIKNTVDKLIARYKNRGIRNNRNFDIINDKANKSIKVHKEVDLRLVAVETDVEDLYGATKTPRKRKAKRLNSELFGINNNQCQDIVDPYQSLGTETDIELTIEEDPIS